MIIAVYIRNFCSCENKTWKKLSLVRDSNPWPLRYRCCALPVKLKSQLGAGRWIGFATTKVAKMTSMIILHLILHSTVHIYDFHIFITELWGVRPFCWTIWNSKLILTARRWRSKQKKKTKKYMFKQIAQYFGLKTNLLQGLKEKWK